MTTEGTGVAGPPLLAGSVPSAPIEAAPGRLPLWLGLVGVAVLLTVLYWPTLDGLVRHWLDDPNYSHGFLVLPISLWLAYRWFSRRVPASPPQVVLGTLEISAGCLMHLAALIVGWPLLDFVGLVLILRGLALGWGGTTWAQGLAFPMLFLIFMFPLPSWLTAALAGWLQDVVARASANVLELFWVCQQRGHAIMLAGVSEPLIVGAECSGLRQLVALVALAALIGYLWLDRWSLRIVLLILAIPVAVLANVLRVLMMAGGVKWFGLGWLDSSWHHAPTLVMFPAELALLLLAVWALSKLPRAAYKEEGSPPAQTGRLSWKQSFALLGSLILGILLQLVLLQHLAAGMPSAPAGLLQPLETLPRSLGDWQGSEHPDAAKLRAKVQFADELLLRKYHKEGALAHVYLVHSTAGKDREHHPEICIRDVAGLGEDQRARAVIHLDEAKERPVQRFLFRSGTSQYFFVWYWHYTLEPPLQEGQTLIQAVHQRVSRKPPSVTVQVTAQVAPADVGKLEQSLLKEVDRAMQQHLLPPYARMNCDRLPVRLLTAD